MRAQFILSGGGEPSDTHHLDEFYRSLLGSEPSICVIPHAVVEAGIWSEEEAVAWVRRRPSLKDVHVFGTMDLSPDNPALRSATSLFLMGGNTFCLIDALRRTDFLPYLRDSLISGRQVIYGCSAGAIIAGHSIAPALFGKERDDNIPGLADLSGLDLLGGVNVFTHYSEADEVDMSAFARSEGRRVLCLPENGGLYWNGDRLRAIGDGAVVLFDTDGTHHQLMSA